MSTQHRGEETRARILAAATECFAQYGYDGTGVAEICRRAGVTKGGFYYHFSTKQALFLELLERWLAGVDAQMAAVRAEADTIPEALMKMTGMAHQVSQAGRGQIPIFLEFWAKAVRDPDIWEATIAPYRRYQTFFADLIKAGVEEGTLRSVDPYITAQVIVSLAVGLVLQGLLDPEQTDWIQVAEDGVRVLLEGIRKQNRRQ